MRVSIASGSLRVTMTSGFFAGIRPPSAFRARVGPWVRFSRRGLPVKRRWGRFAVDRDAG
jgi:hypothetical protein